MGSPEPGQRKRQGIVQVCVGAKGKQEWEAEASNAGISTSQWVQQQLDYALHGSRAIEGALRKKARELEEKLVSLQEVQGQLAVENSKMKTKLDGIQDDLLDAIEVTLAAQNQHDV